MARQQQPGPLAEAEAPSSELPARKRATGLGLIALMAIGSATMWIVNPIAWLYLVSTTQESSAPALGPYLLVLVGIIVTMVVIGKGLGMLDRAYRRLVHGGPGRVVQPAWLRSLRGARTSQRDGSVLDVVMIVSVALSSVAAAIWFFGFAGSSIS